MQAQANSVDPDQTSTEYHIYYKYSNKQAVPNSVEPDQTPTEYHIYEVFKPYLL